MDVYRWIVMVIQRGIYRDIIDKLMYQVDLFLNKTSIKKEIKDLILKHTKIK